MKLKEITKEMTSIGASVLLAVGMPSLIIGGCLALNGGIRSPDNPKLQVSESKLSRNYSEHTGLTYIDYKPYGSLNAVIDYTSGERKERYETNLTQKDSQEFKRLLSEAEERHKTYIPF